MNNIILICLGFKYVKVPKFLRNYILSMIDEKIKHRLMTRVEDGEYYYWFKIGISCKNNALIVDACEKMEYGVGEREVSIALGEYGNINIIKKFIETVDIYYVLLMLYCHENGIHRKVFAELIYTGVVTDLATIKRILPELKRLTLQQIQAVCLSEYTTNQPDLFIQMAENIGYFSMEIVFRMSPNYLFDYAKDVETLYGTVNNFCYNTSRVDILVNIVRLEQIEWIKTDLRPRIARRFLRWRDVFVKTILDGTFYNAIKILKKF